MSIVCRGYEAVIELHGVARVDLELCLPWRLHQFVSLFGRSESVGGSVKVEWEGLKGRLVQKIPQTKTNILNIVDQFCFRFLGKDKSYIRQFVWFVQPCSLRPSHFNITLSTTFISYSWDHIIRLVEEGWKKHDDGTWRLQRCWGGALMMEL